MTSLELLIFEVGNAHFSVPLSLVEEVVPSSQITRIPNSPPFLLGLAAVRGKVMGVIDSALRYNLPLSLKSYFMVCHVRGNVTAITIDRPVMAGMVPLRELDDIEREQVRKSSGLDAKFVKGGYELFENYEELGAQHTRATGIKFLCVEPDLFVSNEMASRVGEAV